MNYQKSILLLSFSVTLFSCTTKPTASSSSSLSSEVVNQTSQNSSVTTTEAGYYLDNKAQYSTKDIFKANYSDVLKSTGEQKLLVVPVYYTNSGEHKSEKIHQDIQKTFFGEADETGWESLASFYHKSSYGKLTITGEVTPWIGMNMSIEEAGNEGAADLTRGTLRRIHNALDDSLLREYDQDGDGWVDSIYIIYAAPTSQDYNSYYWAFVWWAEQTPNIDKPTFNVHSFSSYKFMYDGESVLGGLDAHTYIHESGHLFGLADYYDYNGKRNPAGGLDMMDYNIGDHNIYSKYLLNWVNPTVVTDDARIRLKPASKSGDFVLLNANWNGSVYDEYILLEYYTPTDLNYQDANYQYVERPFLFKENGVKVWHVDSRLSHNKTEQFTTEPGLGVDFYTDNSYKEIFYNGIKVSEDFKKQITLLNSPNANINPNRTHWASANYAANDNSLFKVGDKVDSWDSIFFNQKGRFNSGKRVGFGFEIVEMNDDFVEIVFNKA